MLLRTALPFLLTACVGLPDRWSATAGKGDGDLELVKGDGDRDFDSTYLEVGVSGPLGKHHVPGLSKMPPWAPAPASAPTEQPEPSGGFPWTEMALLLGGASGMKGSEYCYRRVRERKRKPTG